MERKQGDGMAITDYENTTLVAASCCASDRDSNAEALLRMSDGEDLTRPEYFHRKCRVSRKQRMFPGKPRMILRFINHM